MSAKNKVPEIKKQNRSALAFENAFFALLETTDCSKISVSDILTLSGYSRTAFYSNYLDKADFIDQTLFAEVDRHVRCVYDSIHKHQELFDGLTYLPMLNLFRHVYKHRSLYHALFASKITGWNTVRFITECRERFEKTVYVEIPQFPQLDYPLYNYIRTAHNIMYISYWDEQNFTQSPEYMAEQAGIALKIEESPFGLTKVIQTAE